MCAMRARGAWRTPFRLMRMHRTVRTRQTEDARTPTSAAARASEGVPDALRPRHLWHRAAQLAIVGVMIAVLIVALPGLGGLRAHFADAQPDWLAIAAAAELGSALSHVAILRSVFCPTMRWGLSYDLAMSELAADAMLPAGGAGGLALGAWVLHRGGMSSEHIARRTVAFFMLTSAANFATVIVAGALSAIGVLPLSAASSLAAVPAALALVTVVLVVAVAPRLLRRLALKLGPKEASAKRSRLRRRLRPLTVEASVTVAEGIRDALSLLRSGDLLVIGGSLGYMAFDIAVLAAAFPATGSAVPGLGTLLLGYSLGQLGGLLPIPGGLGATGGGLIGAFVLYGAPIAPVTAAVLVYRALQLGLPALLGAPAFALLHRALRRPDAAIAFRDPLSGAGAESVSRGRG